MGVKSLWSLLTPVGRPVMLETMEGKSMAIDSSIWLYQFQATMRDKEGRVLVNAHVLGFLRRISKLLFYGIKPVFVFDGGAPALKRATITERKMKKSGASDTHTKLAEKLLAAQLRREAVNQIQKSSTSANADTNDKNKVPQGPVILDENTVYLEDIDGSTPITPSKNKEKAKSSDPSSSQKKKIRFHDYDPYRLPDVDMAAAVAKAIHVSAPDPRLATEEELRAFIEEMRPEDFDVSSPSFRELPTEVQYEIIGDLRLKSRQTSHKRLQSMLRSAKTPIDFSKAQIKNLQQRNALTQQLLTTTDSIGKAHVSIPIRIAAERNREYVLVKNEGEDGGWVLGIRDEGTATKPIKVDEDEERQSESDNDNEMEEVAIPTPHVYDPDLREYQREMALSGIAKRSVKTRIFNKTRGLRKPVTEPKKKSIPLFVPGDDDDDDDMPLRMPGDMNTIEADEIGDLSEAIEVSLAEQESIELQKAIDLSKSDLARSEVFQVSDSDSVSDDFYVPTRLDTALSFANTGSVIDHHIHPSPKQQKKLPTPIKTPVVINSPSRSTSVLPLRTMTTSPSRSSVLPMIQNVSDDDDDMEEIVAISDPRTGISNSFEKKIHDEFDSPVVGNAVSRRTPLFLDDVYDVSPATSPVAGPSRMRSNPNLKSTPFPVQSVDDIEPSTPTAVPSSVIDIDIDDLHEPSTKKVAPTNSGADIPGSSADLSIDISDFQNESSSTMKETPTRNLFTTANANISGSSVDEPIDISEVDERSKPTIPSSPSSPMVNTSLEFSHESNRSRSASPEMDSILHPLEEEHEQEHEHWDAAQEIDVQQEEGEFANFVSQVKGKDLDTVRREIDEEIYTLNQQRKAAMRDSEDVTQQMISQIMTMLRLFGIPYITSPMEAEAQCAELVELGLVDGIITDDSDVFLFGGQRVFKNMFNQSKTVECFLLTDLSRELGLDRDKLIRLAYLLGSDYVEGLPGVGPVVAMELLKEFPGSDGLHKFRDWWRKVQSGRDKQTDTSSPLRRRFKKRFKDLYLPTEWPNPAVRDAYYHPTVDHSEEPFKWGLPDLDGLRGFFQEELYWSASKVDELLLPIIRKMGKRSQADAMNKQSNLNSFFDITAGSGIFEPRKRQAYSSKRLQQLVADHRKEQARRKRKDQDEENETSSSGEDDKREGAQVEKAPQKGKRRKTSGTDKSSDKASLGGRGRGQGRARGRGRTTRGRGRGGGKGASSSGISTATREKSDDSFEANGDDGDNNSMSGVERAAALNLRPRPKARQRVYKSPSPSPSPSEV